MQEVGLTLRSGALLCPRSLAVQFEKNPIKHDNLQAFVHPDSVNSVQNLKSGRMPAILLG